MLFSVVIPTHNRAVLLREALESVFAQQFGDFEVIVVDDGSTDDTELITRSFGKSVRLVKQENRGPGAARNTGIHGASGDYIVFLDSDDIWFPWTLATHAQAILFFGRPSFVAGRGVALSDFRDPLELRHPFRSEQYADMLSACRGTMPPVGGTSSIAVKAKCIRDLGGFCEEFLNGEDTDLWLRLGSRSNFVRIQDPVLFAQRYPENRMTSNLERSVRGSLFLAQREAAGHYPGGNRFAKQRRKIIAATMRNVSLECLRLGERKLAWRLFRASFKWNLQLWRLRYFAGFPILCLLSLLRSNPRTV
jgi:glycosyltransferase involved in cell wall biosynthesis